MFPKLYMMKSIRAQSEKLTGPKAIKILVFILILLFYGTLLFHKIQLPVDDLGRHIENGAMVFDGKFDVLTTNFYSSTESNFPFINHHWLSGVIFYLLYNVVGFGGLCIFNILVMLSAFTILFFTALKKANFWLVSFLSLPTILILMSRVGLRPEIFSYLFTALFLYFLIDLDEHPKSKRIFWLIPLELLWVNLHIFFFVGILLVGGFLGEKILLNLKNLKNNPLIKKLLLLLVALVLICIINPNGVKGALYPLHIFDNYGVSVVENQPPFLQIQFLWRDVSVALFGPMVMLWLIGCFLNIKKKPIFYFIAGAGSALSGFILVRNLPFFGLVFLPATSFNFNDFFSRIKEWLEKEKPKLRKILGKILIIGLFCIFFYMAFLGSQKNKLLVFNQQGVGLTPESDNAAFFFKEQGLHGPIFNDYDIGSYLVFYLFPKERPFVDNRPEAYPASFLAKIDQMLSQESVWQRMQKQYNFNVIFFYQRDASENANEFIWRRVSDPDWSLVYADTYSVIFLKNVPGNQSIINKFKITKDNIEQRINYLLDSKYPDDLLSAGHLFEMVGREDLALLAYKKMVTEWPDESPGWTTAGIIESRSNDPIANLSAIVDLEKAIALGEKTAENYTYLGLAYFKSAQFEKAQQDFLQALKIEPDRADAKDYLRQLQKYLNPAN